jgi:hypothetical protein
MLLDFILQYDLLYMATEVTITTQHIIQ